MPTPHHPSAAVRKVLAKRGGDIRDARRRRRLPMAVVADRAFTSRSTLQRIEQGDPAVGGRGQPTLFAWVAGVSPHFLRWQGSAHTFCVSIPTCPTPLALTVRRMLPSPCHYRIGLPEEISILRLYSTVCGFPCQRFKCALADALT